MNRVLIFVDDDIFSKTPTGDDPLKYYGIGLGTDIVTVSSMAEINEKGEVTMMIDYNTLRQNQLKLGEGDRALIVGKKAWDILCKVYHNGLRAENGFDASRLDRLGLNCGAFIKVLWGDKDYGMDKVDIPYFMSDEFVDKWDYNTFKQVIVSYYDDAMRFLSYLNSLTNEEFGFDYETNKYIVPM